MFSFSRVETYRQCPLKYKFKYLDGIVPVGGPLSPALQRGLDTHKKAEDYINGNSVHWTDEEEPLKEWLSQLGTAGAEIPLGVNRRLEPEPFATAYFRGIADIITNDTVWDLKTGSGYKYDDTVKKHLEQVQCYADMVEATAGVRLNTGIYYVDKPGVIQTKPKAHALEQIVKECGIIENTKVHAARINRFCNWCEYSKKMGGPCYAA